jgi:hypothetical protein
VESEDHRDTHQALDQNQSILVASSRVAAAIRTAMSSGISWVRNSTLYSWLTAEPDPDVVVIDLRETYTVGPFIMILDKLIPHIERGFANSRLSTILSGVLSPIITSIGETQLYALIIRLLEPPDPPETRTDTDESSSEEKQE